MTSVATPPRRRRRLRQNLPYVCDIPGGVFPGKAILIKGSVVDNPKQNRFAVDLCCGQLVQGDHQDNKALHLNPRFESGGKWFGFRSSCNALNQLSRQLCAGVTDQERQQAEQALSAIIETNECLQNCLLLLEQGQPPYAVVVATGALKRALNRKIGVTTSDRLKLSRYLLEYMVSRVTSLPKYDISMLCKVFSLLTKVGWLERDPDTDETPFQEPVKQLLSLTKESTQEGWLALKILTSLVEEINMDEGLDSISRQRKISGDFRDVCLLDVFTLSLDVLNQFINAQLDDLQLARLSQALDLTLACMNYDFIGSITDETLDENISIQIPTKWKPVLMERQVGSLFFRLYMSIPVDLISKSFQTVVQLTSVRRMLFDPSDRQKYLDQIVTGLKLVLDNPAKLQEPENFHQFCRILSRLKASYQVSELVKCQDFSALLPMITQFTLQSLRMVESFTQNSVYYLMSFWSRMAGSLSYSRVDVEFISESVPQDDHGTIKQLMELFTVVSRRDYKRTAQDLILLFDENMSILTQAALNNDALTIARKRLIWIITMMAAGVNGKTASNSCEVDDDVYDGEVVSRVWKLMRVTDTHLSAQQQATTDMQLEFAYLYLMDEFRKAYISDQIQRESRVYEKLNVELGIGDDAAALRFYAQKIITNLKFWGHHDKLLAATLGLLGDLTVGFANVRRLLKTEEIQLLLKNHSTFDFVSSNNNLKIMKSRTNFYTALVRLLNLELDDDVSMFEMFMEPISAKFKEVYELFQRGDIGTANQQSIQMLVIGLCRDLRGVASSCSKKSTFNLLLNWTLPEVFAVLQGAVQLWADVANVMTPIMKLVQELTLNRQSRLSYDMHSCVSVILFREVSKIICDYGVICGTLRHVLSGGYLPFGVFWIYGDNCLNNSLDIAFKLFVRLQEEDLLAYSKISQCLYYWLDIVTRDNMAYVSKLDDDIFLAVLKAVHKGILCIDTTIISSSCTILDQILDYLFERMSRTQTTRALVTREPEGDNCMRAIEKAPNLLYELLTSILSQLLFEEVKCQWSMSRPLLGLIIANGDRFTQWKNDFITRQPQPARVALEQSFAKLMDGIKMNVSIKNKDNFTQNLSSFRKEVETILKGSQTQGSGDTDYADNQFMTD
ncbi:galactoside-binding lectin domain-containing protein [Ditylenchus destructor]|uniref:Galactoside-binding lectin domain-containing protein n=1 Tax=Ditylenchus destructor TaxID=166010 RepID=A0AAD4NAN9_9BILA|nr:galactoside-binding lectin domain-containing protein [Ditylenchus destructor]